MLGCTLNDCRLCSTEPGSLKVKPAALFAPVIFAVTDRFCTIFLRDVNWSYATNAPQATTRAMPLVSIVIRTSLRLIGKFWRKRITFLFLPAHGLGQLLQLRADF